MIIAVAHTKGGVGKTTIALNLAIERARAGRDVWLIDADRQGTAQAAIAQRAADDLSPPLACSQFTTAATLRDQLRLQGPKFDDVVIDVGGRDGEALRAALVLADVVLTPFAPRTFDVWALEDIAALIKEAEAYRAEPIKAFAVINQADSRGGDNEAAAAAVVEPFKLISPGIGRRKSIADAAGGGRSAAEAVRRDPKSVAEIEALVSQVFSM
ncbi:AAA family ATPase [Neomegalonema perideroedes]|uniref:AAA family ATPase n=1 Tax=Neomegalonema perideroedes TaxID=217219 RepID=UPI0003631BE7|nr:AAA family ATPase [Neomegalonema perideroedes]